MKIDTKALTAEFLGTFTLALAVVLSVNNPDFPIPTPVIAALTLGLFVYTIGKYSGCHINPAVTLGLWAVRKIDTVKGLAYIVTQLVAGAAALGVAILLLGDLAAANAENTLAVGTAEGIGTAILTFGIAAAVFKAVSAEAAGLVIGGSLLLGISIAAFAASNGILNPAVALALGSFNTAYVLGALAGGVAGALIYRYGLATGK